MKLSQFKYNLPEALIAKHPVPNRDEARLMVLHRKEKKIEHKLFKDILDIFNEDDVFILNNTKVFPARLYGNKEKTGAKIEVFMLRELNNELRLWDVLVDPARKIRVGNKLYFGNDDLVAEVVDNTTSRGRTIRFLFDGSDDEFRNLIEKLGETPIPRYLGRDVEKEDKDRYQTIFAKEEGAVAPPAAGLHFSRELMMRMEIKGIKFTDVTLHIGLGTFRDVEVEDLTKHKMDSENYTITQKTADLVNNALEQKQQRIVAVGSSVMRAVQSSVSSMNRLNPSGGWTDKFIFPPYDFKIANAFITNFHPSEATLLMQTAAFAEYDFLMEAYKEAIKEKYRFLCYGDAMLIL
jgi:S-adenosylmethionine:tRNA ribosyltransferase-isomerase